MRVVGQILTTKSDYQKITMDMLDEGSTNLTGGDLSAQLRNLGSTLSVQSSPDGSTIQIQTLKQNLPQTLDLLRTVMMAPTFSNDIWKTKRVQYQQMLAQQHNDAKSIARNVWNKLVYGNQYTEDYKKKNILSSITVDSMKEWYNQFITPQTTNIWVGGATTTEEVLLFSREILEHGAKRKLIFQNRPMSSLSRSQPSEASFFLSTNPVQHSL